MQRTSGGRVTRAETIHLTLAFLGEVDESALSSLRGISTREKKHRLPIEQSRYWPRNRIVWVGPDTIPEPLMLLAENLRKKLREKSFQTEARPFAAHVTLIRKARDPGELPPLPAIDWRVEEFVLVRSHLSAEGSRYEVLERYPLS